MVDVLRADYVRMARLNGQPERRVVRGTRCATHSARRSRPSPRRCSTCSAGSSSPRASSTTRGSATSWSKRYRCGRPGDRRDRDDPRRDLHRHQHRRRPGGDPRGAEAEDKRCERAPAHASPDADDSGKIGIGVLVIRPRRSRSSGRSSPRTGSRTPIGAPGTPPSGRAPLGTDYLGRDVLSRVLHGGLSVIWIGARSDPARLRGRDDHRADRRLPAARWSTRS